MLSCNGLPLEHHRRHRLEINKITVWHSKCDPGVSWKHMPHVLLESIHKPSDLLYFHEAACNTVEKAACLLSLLPSNPSATITPLDSTSY